jgi:hypothetical protein
MVPEPNDGPKPDDEIDDEPDNEPDDEIDDEDDETDDETDDEDDETDDEDDETDDEDDETDDEPDEEPDDGLTTSPSPARCTSGRTTDGRPNLAAVQPHAQPQGGADTAGRRIRFLYYKVNST